RYDGILDPGAPKLALHMACIVIIRVGDDNRLLFIRNMGYVGHGEGAINRECSRVTLMTRDRDRRSRLHAYLTGIALPDAPLCESSGLTPAGDHVKE
ncbi:MAG: hypothetical protein ACREH8_11070, partial [Opitutaceae bacterium]